MANAQDNGTQEGNTLFNDFQKKSYRVRLEVLKDLLSQKTAGGNVLALSLMSADLVEDLFQSLVELSSHWKPEVRAQAISHLRWVEPSRVTEVIREGLRDPHRDVRHAAAELFHSHERKAA